MSRSTRAPQDSRQVLADALRTIERLRRRLSDSRDSWLDEPIAIVGMACRFPGGANSPEEFWALLRNGVDATGEFPADRGDAAAFYHPDPDEPGKAYTIRGAFLDQVDRFEPEVFGVSPREALGIDPQHRIALEITWEALERAGYAPDRLTGANMGVYFGQSTTDYVRARQHVGDIDDVDIYQLTGEPSFLAGRISYLLGLQGPSKVIDTSCSSSLVGLHEACQALRLRECDTALAGGVNLLLNPYGFVLMSKFRGLSADGRCKTFDASADGYARGEGAGVVVLKRLSDAQDDRDPIVAVIRGSAVNHDGRSSGLTVPNPAAQQDVITAALARAKIDPADVDYVEAHGTGTSLGDPIELRALEAVVGRHRGPGDPLLVGSVKTNIGHLESAAGMAGLLKVVLSIANGEIPPHLNMVRPNPNLDWSRLHVKVPQATAPWPERGHPRTGAVSSFGASGTNAHVVVTAPPPEPPRPGESRAYGLFLASARTEDALRELADRHARWLRGPNTPEFGDACYTTHVGRVTQAHGIAVVATSADEVAETLDAYAREGRGQAVLVGALPRQRDRKVAWLFTGQGAQYPGMAKGLLAEPAFRDAIERCAELFDPFLDRPLREVLWPHGADGLLDDTRYTQPALFTVEYALAQLALSWGLRPSAVAGHSLGEIVAACVAGVLDLPAAATLVAARSGLMAALPPGGAMAAVSCAESQVREAIAGYPDTVAVAAVNGPAEVTISGAADDVDAVLRALTAEGVRGRRLTVSHAFHSPLIAPMLDEFRARIASLRFQAPRIPLVSNVTGRRWTEAEVGPDYWIRHAAAAVRFQDGVRTLHAEGIRTFLELGPAPVLSALAGRCLPEGDCVFVPTLRRGTDDVRGVLRALGILCLRGARPDWSAFHAVEDVRAVALPTTPWRGAHYWFREAAPVDGPAADPGIAVAGIGSRLRGPVPAYELEPAVAATLAGERAVPLGALVDLARAAARDGLGGDWPCAEEVASHTPVPADDPAGYTLQLTVTAGEDGAARWELLGLAAAQEAAAAPPTRHASGLLRRRWRGPDTPVSTGPDVAVPAGGDWSGILAAARRALIDVDGAGAAVPVRCAALGAAGPLSDVVAVRVVSADGTVDLVDRDGTRVGQVRGLTLAVPPAPPAPWYDPADLLYDLVWEELDGLPAGDPGDRARAGEAYLIVAEDGGRDRSLVDGLGAALESAGATVSVVPPPVSGAGALSRPDPEAVRGLIDAWLAGPARPARILVLTGLAAPAPDHCDAWSLDEYAARADLTVVALLRELAARDDCPDARISLITRGAARIASDPEPPNPTASTLWGLGRVLALEHPERWGGAVDLDPGRPTGEERALLSALAADGDEDQQALRGERRFGLRLVPVRVDPAELRREAPVDTAGSYLVTGAFGGIGQGLAQWLARAGAGRLVLLARTALPERSRWDEAPAGLRDRIDAVRRLEAMGAIVDVVAADVSDEAAMVEVFAELDRSPYPLRGVVHAAGVSAPQYAREATPEEYRLVWRPKVIGGWLLHRLSAGARLDFFLGFSSIAATWGSQHLASYAAGNAFLDALAQHRAAAGLPGLSVAWGPWDLPSALFGEEVMSFLRATGLRPLSAPQCLRLLAALAAGDAPQRVVCAVDWSIFKPVMQARTERPVLRGIADVDASLSEQSHAPVLDEVRAAGDPARARALLLAHLTGMLADVLGADPATVDGEAEVMAYGLDSLMVMDVVRRCRRDLGVTLRAGDLFERETLREWAELVAEEVTTRSPDGAGGYRPADADEPIGAGPASDPLWIREGVSLDAGIAVTGTVARVGDPREVLLTGATGFVGAFLLRELLATTSARVHCLVRCDGEADGLRRVRENVERYLPWPDGIDERVSILPGDLARPGLGLAPEVFGDLAGRLDGIYHNGAWVNFSYTYDQLRPANIAGTEEILRLAASGRPTGVHLVSTYGIWGLPIAGREVVGEDEDIATAGRLVTGYVQSKWGAERLAELARERGVPVDVYRPGRVLGDSRTGACLTTHFTTRVIKGCIQLGMAPDIDIDVEMTPVDYVAAALVHISRHGPAYGGAYHLINPHRLAFVELVEALRRYGFAVTRVPVEDWWQELKSGYALGSNELHPVMPVVQEFVVGGEDAIEYGTGNTEEQLRGSGIACPRLDDRLLDTYLSWMVRTGYLPTPGSVNEEDRAI